MAVSELDQIKQQARMSWAAGDYELVAKRLVWEVGERIVDRLSVGSGDEVLDVACGTGNGAIRAAKAGAHVVGLDLTPELLAIGERLAGEAGVTVTWVEGDAEQLPFQDESFDVVISLFGCMFAPRHAVAAHELARVLRPGGRLGICSWTPEGSVGQFYRTLGGHLPPQAEVAEPALLWGSDDHVRSLFDGTAIALEFAREKVVFPRFESADEQIEFYSTKLGPLVLLRAMTEAEGRWSAVRDDLATLYEPQEIAEYLTVTGTKA